MRTGKDIKKKPREEAVVSNVSNREVKIRTFLT